MAPSTEARRGWIVIAVACLVFLLNIVSPPRLMDDVDAVQAQIPRNMLLSGDWVTARLNGVAGCDEVVVGNMLYQRLPDAVRAEFQELPPVEAKNIGRVRAWRGTRKRCF